MLGVDNNLTQEPGGDPVQIAMLKGLVAGSVNVSLAIALGAAWPGVMSMSAALLLGFLSYGVSLVLFVFALRHLGTARTGAYFSTAPFVGAAISLIAFREPLTRGLVGGALLMGVGVWLHLTERHEHEHEHEAIEHEHSHVHDEHHRHAHDVGDPRVSRIPMCTGTAAVHRHPLSRHPSSTPALNVNEPADAPP